MADDFEARFNEHVVPDLRREAVRLGGDVAAGRIKYSTGLDELLSMANRRGSSHLSEGARGRLEERIGNQLSKEADLANDINSVRLATTRAPDRESIRQAVRDYAAGKPVAIPPRVTEQAQRDTARLGLKASNPAVDRDMARRVVQALPTRTMRLSLAAFLLCSTAAHAVVVVEDVVTEANTLQSTIHAVEAGAKRIEMINNQLTQIIHLKNTFEAVAHGDLAAIGNIAPQLSALGITLPLGSDVSGLVNSIGGAIGAGGELVGAANTTGFLTQELLRQDQWYTPTGADMAARMLNQLAMSAAASKAAAQTALDSNTQRIQQLNTLRAGLANKDVTAAAQSTARLAGEQATAQAQTNQLLALLLLRDGQRATTEAQQQQMARCASDKFVLEAKASIEAAQAGAVNLIGPTVSAINCTPPPSSGVTAPVTQISTNTAGTLVSGGLPASPVSADSTALGTMLATSWGQTAADNATALGVNPTALAATCVLESNCQANPGGTGTISGAFQMTNGTFAQTVQEVSASNPALASQILSKNDPASQSIAASQYLLDGANSLISAGIMKPTALDVRGFYQFGPANGAYLAGAPDNQLMVATLTGLSSATLAANNITSNTTVGQWRATVVNKIGSAASQPVLLGSPT